MSNTGRLIPLQSNTEATIALGALILVYWSVGPFHRKRAALTARSTIVRGLVDQSVLQTLGVATAPCALSLCDAVHLALDQRNRSLQQKAGKLYLPRSKEWYRSRSGGLYQKLEELQGLRSPYRGRARFGVRMGVGERVGRAARPRNSGRSSVRQIVPLSTCASTLRGIEAAPVSRSRKVKPARVFCPCPA